jgi:hypothetical protein
MKVNLILISIIIFLTAIGCQKPSPTVDEDVYVDMLTELELIFVLQSQTKEAELTQELIDGLWEKYDVSEEDFLYSHFIYEQDIDGQIRRIKTITERLTLKHLSMEDSLGTRYLEDHN